MKHKQRKNLNSIEYSKIRNLIAEYGQAQTAKLTGRGSSTTSYISRSANFEDYRRMVRSITRKPKTPVLVLTRQTNGINQNSNRLEVALNNLDGLFGQIKDGITTVVLASVEIQVAEEKNRLAKEAANQEAELVSLRTVVDAAKSKNLVETLKDKLMGNQLN